MTRRSSFSQAIAKGEARALKSQIHRLLCNGRKVFEPSQGEKTNSLALFGN